MNVRLILRIQGGLLLFLAAALLVPLPFSLRYGDGAWLAFALSAAVTGGAGATLLRLFREAHEMRLRDGFASVSLAWVLFAAFGSLPYLLSGTLPEPVKALFETMSGFTTTGSSTIADVTAVGKSVLLWRALTHWIGGMGIVVMSIAILPMLGSGGILLFDAEVPGPTADHLTPRIRDTAKLLSGIYVLITAAEVGALMLGGVSFFESLCHAFATVSTGGFSTRNGSVGELGGTYVHVVVMVAMFLAGTNFSLHAYALRGRLGGYWRSDEFRFYCTIVGAATLVCFLANLGGYGDPLVNLRDSAFQVISCLTCTGFATADYELWRPVTSFVLLLLMLWGGCSGSTSGGLKLVRVRLLFAEAAHEVSRIFHPRRVTALRLDGKPVSATMLNGVLGIVVIHLTTFVVASLLLAGLGLDLATACSSTITCLSGVGPGIGHVGPMENFAGLPAAAHILLSICMLVGRLEFLTLYVLFFPSFWRK